MDPIEFQGSFLQPVSSLKGSVGVQRIPCTKRSESNIPVDDSRIAVVVLVSSELSN